MRFLVDGNNVMAQNKGWHRDKSAARRRLIVDLARFIAAHRDKVTVVFDGAPDEDFPDGRVYKSVRIHYARPGSDADSRIKDMVDRASFKRDMTVVTSDKPLGSFVSRKGAKVMQSGLFRRKLGDAVEAMAENEKTGNTGPVDVDDWMRFFNESSDQGRD